MKIYDISREVFSARVFPGDPVPGFQPVLELEKGAPCSLTQLSLGLWHTTHGTLPAIFLPKGEPSTRWSSPGAWVPAGCLRPMAI